MLRARFERLRRGWSLQTLGFYVGMSVSDISKIERGLTVPYSGQRTRLAAMLGIPVDELLREVSGDEVSV